MVDLPQAPTIIYSDVAGRAPTASQLADGALGINRTDQKFFIKDASGAVLGFPLGTPAPSGFRNLLLNGSFTVNQPGYVSGTAIASGYGFPDQWATANGATLTFAASAAFYEPSAGGAIDVAVTIAGQNILQLIEGRNIKGGVYTFSWAGTSTGYVQYFNGSTYVVVGDGTSPVVTSAIPQGATTMVVLRAGTNVTRVQLEAGPIATPFERRPPALEIMLCRRYFQRLGGTAIYKRFGIGVAGSSSFSYINLEMQRGMRGCPTVTTPGNFVLYDGITLFTVSGIYIDTGDGDGIDLYAFASGLTPKTTYMLCANNDATAHIDLSARL